MNAMEALRKHNLSKNELSQMVFNGVVRTHRSHGPSLIESAFEECLYDEFRKTNLKVEKQRSWPFVNEGVKLDVGNRTDLLLNIKPIFEVKSVEALNEVRFAELLTYTELKD